MSKGLWRNVSKPFPKRSKTLVVGEQSIPQSSTSKALAAARRATASPSVLLGTNPKDSRTLSLELKIQTSLTVSKIRTSSTGSKCRTSSTMSKIQTSSTASKIWTWSTRSKCRTSSTTSKIQQLLRQSNRNSIVTNDNSSLRTVSGNSRRSRGD